MPSPKTLISVVGPTAIGKTALGIQIAQHFQTEIVSADSRQFFREMEIGTAKPDADELAAAKHHFINSHSVTQLFSTGDFEQQGLRTIDQIFSENQMAVMVGGSGLYVNAIHNGLDEMPEIDLSIREALNNQFKTEGLASIRAQLEKLDPEYYIKVDQHNPQRMIRGLEVVLSTGQKLSSMLSSSKKQRAFNIIKIGLNTERARLYDRINKRVDQMLDKGLVEEVRSLLPYRTFNALNTVGYSEIFDYLDDKISLEEAVAAIKQNTRRFAKRQLTWFRRDPEITWFEPGQTQKVIDHIKSLIK